jgi:hypothetical protein
MDRTGRNLHEGQLVDVSLMGMYTAGIVKVVESSLIVSGQPALLPSVILQVMIQLPIEHNRCNSVYIIKPSPARTELTVDGYGKPEPDKPEKSNIVPFPNPDTVPDPVG